MVKPQLPKVRLRRILDGFRKLVPVTAVKIRNDGGLLRWEMRRGKFEFSLVMPRARSQRLLLKRSFLTGQQLGRPRVPAVLDKVEFLVPDTYSDCGVTSEPLVLLLVLDTLVQSSTRGVADTNQRPSK